MFERVKQFIRVLLQQGRVQVEADADEWKDVDVRRLSVEIEESLNRELHWVVSRRNNERTWTRAREQADEVLLRFWQEGKLKGANPEEAFAVRCDRTTMTQNDLDNGRLVLLVEVAPEKRAEFVCIRIQRMHTHPTANGRRLTEPGTHPPRARASWSVAPVSPS